MLRRRAPCFVSIVAAALVGVAARTASADSWIPEITSTFDTSDYVTGLGDVTDFRWLPDGRMIIVEKSGAAHVRAIDGTIGDAGSFPVSTTSEQGLLGVEVDPAFATTKRLFFYYSADASAGGTSEDRQRVVSMLLKDDGTLDFTTEKILLRGMYGPANHDGGSLAIGPDGKLYVGDGDSGCNSNTQPDPPYTPTNFFGTCLTLGNGKIMRINLDGTIPDDNPLVGVGAASACGSGGACGAEGTDPATLPLAAPRTEIWAWGFRNPWRTWFDPVTGSLWVGDVGEITYEEIDIVHKGKHHGWPWREAAHGWPTSKCQDITPNVGDCVDPIYECQHGTATPPEDGNCQSINGGLIVDSCHWPAPWKGLYYFGDNSNGRVWTLQPTTARDGIVAGSRQQIGKFSGGVPVSIRNGPDGNLYFALIGAGRIARLAPKSPIDCTDDAGTDATPPDGSTTDSGTKPDSSTGGDSSTSGDSSTNDDAANTSETNSSSGCGCAVVGARQADAWAAIAITGLATMLVRRRRRC